MSNADIFGFRESIEGQIDGDRMRILKGYARTAKDAAVPPGQSVEFEFNVALFPFSIEILNWGDHVGTTERRVAEDTFRSRLVPIRTSEDVVPILMARRRPPGMPDDFGLATLEIAPPPEPLPPPPDSEVPFEITLTPPPGLRPIVLTNPKASQLRSLPSDAARIDPAHIDRYLGYWRISVKNINATARRLEVYLGSTHAVTPIGHQDIPLSLLNNLASVVLNKTLPTIEYDKDSESMVVSTPTHFLDLMGVDRVFSLGSIAKVLDDMPTFTPMWARMMSRADFIVRLTERKAQLRSEYQAALDARGDSDPSTDVIRGDMNDALTVLDDAIERLRRLSQYEAAFCIVLEGMFTDPEIEVRYIGTIAEIDNKIPQVGLVFSDRFRFTEVITTLAIDLSPVLVKAKLAAGAVTVAVALLAGPVWGLVVGLFALVGKIKLYNSIDDDYLEEVIRNKIRGKGDTIAAYVKRALERITAFGAVAVQCNINPRAAADDSDILHIQYFNPSTARPPRPWHPISEAVGVTSEVLELASGEVMAQPARALTYVKSSTGRNPRYVERLTAVQRELPGPMPKGFKVPNRETLERLDDHDCIVIVMMENRSYDHFFHDLPLVYPDRGYRQPPASYRNSAPPGFKEPFRIVKNTSIGIGNSLIFTLSGRSSDPSHNYDHTMFQIGGRKGHMRGFAADFAKKSDSPQIVMSYFSMDDLPVYKALANYYPVCDRWFAALPVGTFPNRLASLQGNVPFLYNVHMEDPALGFLEDYSIFDLLNSQGISWKFFESDIGTIRLYDRFRLDVTNVRPFSELGQTLRDAGRRLPRVIFIEPHFLFGNDDHPPMDVQQGQAFIRGVIGKFIEHGLMDRTLFVITYDEHGGFFDHVPPPGTRKGVWDNIPYGKVESLYPQDSDLGPPCLGVRVPTLVLSKWTSVRANHTILDHTAILKTILLHNRDRISTSQFGRFGERVMKRGHLGQVLDRETARTIDYAALKSDIGHERETVATVTKAVIASRALGMTPSHPANVLRGIALPRGRVIAEPG